MLEVLFGNKNVQRILIFLFVNGRCYGTQLHRCLKSPLTPIQKALDRLEKGGLVHSYFEGKTKLYQFNPTYPLIVELETLLKKAYTLLPANEKKNYYVIRQDLSPESGLLNNQAKILHTFWEKLMSVKHLMFKAKTKSKEANGWNGKGTGEVMVSKEGNILLFHEKGVWQNQEGAEIGFSNVFRWTLDRAAGVISLEHLRHGPDRPVFLFHMAPSGRSSLSSVDSHLCGGDTYFGQIHFDRHGLRLNWRVIGPKKNEEIDYYYS
jgi:hypothetical protein